MAAIEQDSDRFSLGQIWSDKRYRAVLTQILVVAGVFFFIAFLAMNAVANLEQLGKTFGFGFLWEPASYDINQALISYTSREDRKSVVKGKSVSVRVDIGGPRILKKKKSKYRR